MHRKDKEALEADQLEQLTAEHDERLVYSGGERPEYVTPEERARREAASRESSRQTVLAEMKVEPASRAALERRLQSDQVDELRLQILQNQKTVTFRG